MKVTLMVSFMLLAASCTSFRAQMQQHHCRLVSQEGGRTVYSPQTRSWAYVSGQECYVCPNTVRYCN